VCLPNAKSVNAFTSYFKQVIESGDYGNIVLPIQHLAVAGKYRIPRGLSFRRHNDAEFDAERIIPFIITTAAASLVTLTVFGVDAGCKKSNIGGRRHVERFCVPIETTFPMLRDLMALEQASALCSGMTAETPIEERADSGTRVYEDSIYMAMTEVSYPQLYHTSTIFVGRCWIMHAPVFLCKSKLNTCVPLSLTLPSTSRSPPLHLAVLGNFNRGMNTRANSVNIKVL
jgi:hypothetical protein